MSPRAPPRRRTGYRGFTLLVLIALVGSILLVLIAALVRPYRFQQLLFLRDLHRQVARDSVSDHRCVSVCSKVD